MLSKMQDGVAFVNLRGFTADGTLLMDRPAQRRATGHPAGRVTTPHRLGIGLIPSRTTRRRPILALAGSFPTEAVITRGPRTPPAERGPCGWEDSDRPPVRAVTQSVRSVNNAPHPGRFPPPLPQRSRWLLVYPLTP
jgi:hypothetical protein